VQWRRIRRDAHAYGEAVLTVVCTHFR
jgi:hypothetical protein